MTPERKLELIKLGCCSVMCGAIVAVNLSPSDVVAAIDIGIVFLCLYTIHCIYQWERKLREAEREAIAARMMARYSDFQDDLNFVNRALSERLETIGDQTCLYNARSHYLQCAINPKGECSKCSHYESIYFDAPQNQDKV